MNAHPTLINVLRKIWVFPSNWNINFTIAWRNFFKIHTQNGKKEKKGVGGEPWTPSFAVRCFTPVPIWILMEERNNKRILLETDNLLKNILQTVMDRLHLMKLKIESWNEVKKAFGIEIT